MKKFAALSLALILMFTGSAFAYLSAHQVKINSVTVGDNITRIDEKWSPPDSLKEGGVYSKPVSVENVSSVPCYVRVFADTTTPEMRKSAEINFNSMKWTKKPDGYYYYNDVLYPGEKTKCLFDSVKALADMDEFELMVYEESVQAEGFQSASEAFALVR
ncbi:MAG: hypothetical protein PUB09_06955 [Firmicutes bacterium]|nr:hypothetical protein [Bacillota bacterium]